MTRLGRGPRLSGQKLLARARKLVALPENWSRIVLVAVVLQQRQKLDEKGFSILLALADGKVGAYRKFKKWAEDVGVKTPSVPAKYLKPPDVHRMAPTSESITVTDSSSNDPRLAKILATLGRR